MANKIAVTGASGHLGNVICRELINRGFQVRAFFHSDRSGLEGLELEPVQGDILDPAALAKLMEDCNVVINCAAIISINGDENGLVFRTNTEGPKNVLAVAVKKGVKKIIHVSSVHAVKEKPHSSVYTETRPYKTEKSFVYDYSKAQGEQILLNGAMEMPVEVIVVRPSCIVGPFDFKPSKIGKALMDFFYMRIPVIPQGGYDFVDVRDVAASVCNAITRGKNREVYLLSGKYYSFKELLSLISLITGKRMPGIVVPFWILKAAVPFVAFFSRLLNDPPSITKESIAAIQDGHPAMNHAKAKAALGHDPRPFRETLTDFFNWIEEAPKNISK